jgi:hypothetical protein
MKKITFLCVFFLSAISVAAQVPAGFSYQAVVRNSSGEIIANQTVKFQFSILRDSESGTTVYKETHSATTNNFGLVNIKVGMGTKVSGTFEPSSWGNNPHFLKVELDVSGETDFVHLGTTQLMSVPYAFHAQTVENDEINDADSDPENEIQTLELNANILSLTPNGGSVSLPTSGGSSPFQSSSGVTSNVTLTDNFVFGSSSLDDISGDNDDKRMFFNKTNGAFRAGRAMETQWNREKLGITSIAMGVNTIASGDYGSVALGSETTASGQTSTAIGQKSVASGNYSVAIGYLTTAEGYISTSIGYHTTAPSYAETVLGSNNSVYEPSNINGWDDLDRLFVIGNGTANDSRRNAITVLKNGNTGLGVDKPSHKLEVNGQVKITGGNPGKGKVLTSDATGLASWETSGELTLPFRGGTSCEECEVFYIYNTERGTAIKGDSYLGDGIVGVTRGTGSYRGVFGYATNSSGVNIGVKGKTNSPTGYSGYFEGGRLYVSGNTGIGVSEPTAKLEVGGQVKITGGSPGEGKVLTSDATGLAYWQNPTGGGLTLPYSGTYSSDDVAFQVTNKGSSAAILGKASAVSAYNVGVRGISYSTDGIGVSGYNSSPSGFSGYFDGGKFYVSGNVGIGNTNPAYKLDVKADSRIQLTKTTGQWIAMRTDGDFLDFSFSGHNLVIKSDNNGENILLNPASTNKVGIRTWTPQYDLDVNGNIRVIGEIYYGGSTTGTTTTKYNKPDYVFENKYKLFTIEEVEKYIEKENHLPWITSAEKEKKENGDVVDMTRMAFETLESVENLQLQLIGQQKQIRELKAENDQLKYRLEKLEQLVGTRAQK